ncbi:MAG: dethiobiotin synthase [Planctomycetota bacterium]|nr:dethiobiotin synthase [Planctomycetota bacterium]
MRFGVHLSMSDGPARGQQIGCQALQVFCGNPRGWTKAPLEPERIKAFREGIAAARIDPVVVHATYLINLAAPDDHIWNLSVEAFLDELRRSSQIGAACYVVHSGSHKGEGEDRGRRRIVEALKRANAEVQDRPEILLENTAGTKNSLGTTFADLALLLDGAKIPRSGICLDTCHALAGGYDLRSPAGTRAMLDELDRDLGLARLRCLHINDSKGDLGSRLDRHEYIGEGCIGDAGFRAFFGDERVWNLPAILETPQDQPDDDQRNLWHAVELACEAGAVRPEVLAALPTVELEPLRDDEIAAMAKKVGARPAAPALKQAAPCRPAAPGPSARRKPPPAKPPGRSAPRAKPSADFFGPPAKPARPNRSASSLALRRAPFTVHGSLPRRTPVAPGLFVTGTDTGVGKTLVACALVRLLRARGVDAVGFKPVASGAENGRWEDAEALHAASERVEPLERLCPLRFAAPLAPVPAAKLEGRAVSLDISRRALAECFDRRARVIVEGIGGLLVPLDERTLVADFLAETGLPALVVARAQLGTVNHTLLTLNELARRGVSVAGVVMNVTRAEDAENAEPSRAEIERHAGRALDAVLPFVPGPHEARLARACEALKDLTARLG